MSVVGIKVYTFSALVLLVCLCSLGCSPSWHRPASGQAVAPLSSPYISDLMLLYQGGTHRLDYNQEQLAPYIYREKEGIKEWLYDGFLFLEFKDNRGYEYAQGYGQQPAGKQQWLWLLGRNFEQHKGVHALNSSLRRLQQQGMQPKRMRKVVLTLPDPIIGFQGWGRLGTKDLDFRRDEDRIEACKWYIDQVIAEWKQQSFEQLQFSGFYWVAETQKSTATVLPAIAAYIKSKGYAFYWIPYMYAEGAADWQKAGFDVAYQQPNYFFKLDRPKTLFTKALEMSDQHGMGLEMEFDFDIEKPAFRQRYYDYIEAFHRGNAWQTKPIAYYEGGGAWLKMAQGNADLRAAYDVLADIVVERQKRADDQLKR